MPPTWVDEDGNVITVTKFQSTFGMWSAESTNYPSEMAEHALAHRLYDVVERAYQRGKQFAYRAAMMNEWAEFCGTALGDGGKTVPVDWAKG